MNARKISLYAMAVFYFVAGINHFIKPDFYRPMMPGFIPGSWHDFLILLSGIAEAGLGLMLFFPQVRKQAALGVILLLIAVYPANIFMAVNGGQGYDFPLWTLWARLPMQFVLIWWAWGFMRQPELD